MEPYCEWGGITSILCVESIENWIFLVSKSNDTTKFTAWWYMLMLTNDASRHFNNFEFFFLVAITSILESTIKWQRQRFWDEIVMLGYNIFVTGVFFFSENCYGNEIWNVNQLFCYSRFPYFVCCNINVANMLVLELLIQCCHRWNSNQ